MAEAITYFSRAQIRCPICDTAFGREEMRTGRGRLNAGKLTDELRRNYEPSKRFGEVVPLLYPVTVCPSCHYAAFERDFLEIPEERKSEIDRNTEVRVTSFRSIVPHLDFTGPRSLKEGLASYYFSTACYDFFPEDFAPTIKQAISMLRGAWLCNDLHAKFPDDNWDYLARLFYRKAHFFYKEAVTREQNGIEGIPKTLNLGPDLDKNYGYDGVLYVAGLLEYKYGPRGDDTKHRQALEHAKRTVSRLFGLGKASKSKPSVILDLARDLYAEISDALGASGEVLEDGPA